MYSMYLQLTHCMLCCSQLIFFKINISLKILWGTLSECQAVWIQIEDPDQDRHFVGPNPDANCLQRLSANYKVVASMERVNCCLLNKCISFMLF